MTLYEILIYIFRGQTSRWRYRWYIFLTRKSGSPGLYTRRWAYNSLRAHVQISVSSFIYHGISGGQSFSLFLATRLNRFFFFIRHNLECQYQSYYHFSGGALISST